MATIYKSPFWDTYQKGIQQGKIPYLSKDSKDWYRRESTKLSVPTNVREILRPEKEFRKRSITPGKLYMFEYDAKLKDTLPYWDRFPVVFPFFDGKQGDRFLGINLHYLPRPYRARLMDSLYDLSNKKMDEEQRIMLSYKILKGVSRYKSFEPCVHTYLYSHIKSPYYQIPGQLWNICLFLPTERFTSKTQYVSNTKVWKDSQEKIWKKHGKRKFRWNRNI